MNYLDIFKKHYSERFTHWNLSLVVECVQSLEKFIDDDELCVDFPLLDEVLIMYDLLRDECVNRCVGLVERVSKFDTRSDD